MIKYRFLSASALTTTFVLMPVVSYAQTSVTLYGAIDTAVGFVSNAGVTSSANRVGFVNSNIQTSSWGLKGSEDLGARLNAVFNLQSTFNPSTGRMPETNVEFAEQAYVGLQSTKYGSLTFGRQFDPVTDLLEPLTADLYFGSIFATVGNVDNYDALLHVDNSIKYVSPTVQGLQFEAMGATNGVAGSVSSGSFYSLGILYAHGGLSVAGGYSASKIANTSSIVDGVTITTPSTTADGLNYGNPVVQFNNISTNDIARVGGQYDFGSAIAGLAYSKSRFRQFASNVTLTFNSGSGFFRYLISPDISVATGYSYTKVGGGGASASYNQASIGSDYYVSKRTDLYLGGVLQRANGQTLNNFDNLIAATATVGDEGFYGTGRSHVMAVMGLRHRF